MRPRPPGRTRDLSGSDVLPSCVTGSSTTAERQRLAIAALPMLPSALSTTSASAMCNFRGSIAHPTRSLCTLRNRRRRRPRNTRYQAGATPYLGRTSTGWITSASPDALTVYVFLRITACRISKQSSTAPPQALGRAADKSRKGMPQRNRGQRSPASQRAPDSSRPQRDTATSTARVLRSLRIGKTIVFPRDPSRTRPVNSAFLLRKITQLQEEPRYGVRFQIALPLQPTNLQIPGRAPSPFA